jgi:hypothetical protein
MVRSRVGIETKVKITEVVCILPKLDILFVVKYAVYQLDFLFAFVVR